MKKIKSYILICLVLILGASHFESTAQSGFVVIVNSDVKEESMNQSSIRRIYFGFTTQWQNFEKIKPAYTKISDEEFWNYISTSENKFKSFWTKRVFSGNGVAPEEFDDSQKVIDFVTRTKGAIGIIPSSAKGDVGSGCKVISLN